MPRNQSARVKQKPSNDQLQAFFSDVSALRALYDRDGLFRKRVDIAIGSSSELTRPWARQLGLPDYADEATILAALSARLRGGSGKAAPAKTRGSATKVAKAAAPKAKATKSSGGKQRGAARGPARSVDNTKLRSDIEQRLKGAGAKGMRAEELSLPFRAIKPAYKRELEKLLADRRISKRGDRRKTVYSWLG